jgi:hypothetical protein
LDQKVIKLPSWYKGEGGNRSFNGKGCLIANSSTELQRNPLKSLSEIEETLKKTFNLKKVIWVTIGVLDDDLSFLGPQFITEEGVEAYTCIGKI